MSDGSRNLTMARADRSVWDRPRFRSALSCLDRDRWLAVAGGSGLAAAGLRRRGMPGALVAAAGAAVAIRALMGRRDLDAARSRITQILRDRGWGREDVVNESSDESFPASDSPSWTPTAGAKTTGPRG